MPNQHGFSILELVIILLLVSILSVYVIFNWPNTVINLNGQAQQLANDLRYTQALAMNNGQRFKLVVTGNTYQIQNNSGTPITLAQGSTTVSLGSGITFGSLTTSTLIYDGKGIPYDSSGTALSSDANFPLISSGQTTTVVVTQTTGRVIVQ